jgi:hypothetical protein
MATQDQKPDNTTNELSSQALALAEQIGRIAGTLEGTAESLVNRASLTDQLNQIREGATKMLNSLTGGAADGRSRAKTQGGRTGSSARSMGTDPAHAPGKRRRKAAPTVRGAKHSDSRIPKMRTAAAVRRRRKSYA